MLTGQQCQLEAGEVHWVEDGGCYRLGERGPCQAGQTLQLTKFRPGCVSLTPKQREKVAEVEPVEEQQEEMGEEEEDCARSEKVKVEGVSGCHELLTRGPCEQEDHWVVLQACSLVGRCERRRCDGQEVWLASQCRCLGEEEAERHCGQHAGLVWSPLGEGLCACAEDYYADTPLTVCHQLGSRGPCLQDQVWLLNQTDGRPHCAANNDTGRFFELLSSKSNRGNSNTARSQGCYVDEAGRCRQIIKIGFRNQQQQQLRQRGDWQDWLEQFPASQSLCSPGGVEPCLGEEGQEGVVWSDGNCYQLATTGPCPPGHWLVLDSLTQPQCQQRECPEDEVLWTASCSCYSLQTNKTLRLKSDQLTPCQDGERLVVSPYGDGICLDIQGQHEHQDEESGTLKFR